MSTTEWARQEESYKRRAGKLVMRVRYSHAAQKRPYDAYMVIEESHCVSLGACASSAAEAQAVIEQAARVFAETILADLGPAPEQETKG